MPTVEYVPEAEVDRMTTYPEAPETARHETVAPDAVTLEIDVMTGASKIVGLGSGAGSGFSLPT